MIEDRLRDLLRDAAAAVAPGADLPADIVLDRPKRKEFGDFSTNLALVLAGALDRSPREVAQALADGLPPSDVVERVEVAGPGFLNFHVTDDWLYDVLRDVVAQGSAYGHVEPTERSVQVEFVSANPTGPLHIGTTRNAVLGDAIARLLEAAGWRVEREYYFNDAGRQMELFGASVEARYLERLGHEAELPEDGYQGAYIADIAADIVAEHGDAFVELPEAQRRARLLAEVRAGCWSRSRGPSSGSGSVSTSSSPSGPARRRPDRRGGAPADRARLRLRVGGRDLLPLDRLRRREGPGRDPQQRGARPTSVRTVPTWSTSSPGDSIT